MNRLNEALPQPGVYLIRNMITWKEYVGSSANVRKRLLAHRSALARGDHANPLLQRSWDKWGPEAFECRAVVYVDKSVLIKAEQHFMQEFQVLDRACGFNIVPRADRRELAAETRAKMSASLKGKNIGKAHTAEVLARIGAALSGRKLSPETIAKRRATLAARSPAEKQAVAAKLSASLSGKKKSPEACANMAAARRKVWAAKRAEKARVATIQQGSIE